MSWVGIEERRGERSNYSVIMNVRVLVMFCGSDQSTVLLFVSCWSFLGIDLNILRVMSVFL